MITLYKTGYGNEKFTFVVDPKELVGCMKSEFDAKEFSYYGVLVKGFQDTVWVDAESYEKVETLLKTRENLK